MERTVYDRIKGESPGSAGDETRFHPTKGVTENMTELELRKKASEIAGQFRDRTISDQDILVQIREIPELVHTKCLSGSNLFLDAVLGDRFSVAMALSEMGADIHWTNEASMIHGNALNVAHTPWQAEQLLALGVEIERNLLFSNSIENPAIVAAEHNNAPMLLYWLAKQKELFADDPDYLRRLFCAAIDMASIINQSNMLSCIIAEDELFPVLKDIYSKDEREESIRLALRSLRKIEDTSLEPRKRELRRILNAQKKELASAT